MAQDDNNNNNTNNSNNSDELYKVSAQDRHAGLRAIEPLPSSSLNLVIMCFDKAQIKVDLSDKERASKLKTEASEWGICDEGMSAAKKILKV